MQNVDDLVYDGLPSGTEFTEEEKQERIKNADALYNLMKPFAKKHGYALLQHGSKIRDIDLVAVAWIENATSPEQFIRHLCLNFSMGVAKYELRPHNRHSYGLFKKGWKDHVIDLSIMCRI